VHWTAHLRSPSPKQFECFPEASSGCRRLARQFDVLRNNSRWSTGRLRTRASERNFTRGYEDRFRPPLASIVLVQTCIACLYSYQNNDKIATILRFPNITLLLYWQLTYTTNFRTRVPVPTVPGYHVPLVPPSRRPCWEQLSNNRNTIPTFRVLVLEVHVAANSWQAYDEASPVHEG